VSGTIHLKELMPSTHPLVPKHKGDIATARRAIEAGFPAVEPILYELLEWLQDCNWPVAHELLPFLRTIGQPLAPHIRRIFATDDHVWQYWICALFWDSPELYAIFREDIGRIARTPTADEHLQEVDEQCARVIAHHEPTSQQ
jgi:hypothetical protein